jgi:formylglycine-generating enzyme required for sulfatase activity/tRNA A-37 threonylcarbamoyl transferase component Bud32
LQPGTRLQDRYVVESILAQGGMSCVYRAQDTQTGCLVAVKVMKVRAPSEEERQQAVQQFQTEAELLRTLDHPGLVPLHDFFIEGANHCMVMDFVEGRSLRSLMEDHHGGMPLAQVLRWMDDLCRVADYLHDHTPPIVFRDLKPDNVMVDDHDHVRLIDFGIAATTNATLEAMFKTAGTQGYAPVEQYGGAVDPRADVYALGATVFTLLTGSVPPGAIEILIGEVSLPHLTTHVPSASPELERLLGRMMALFREDRPQSMAAVRTALRQVPEFQPTGRRPAYRQLAVFLYRTADLGGAELQDEVERLLCDAPVLVPLHVHSIAEKVPDAVLQRLGCGPFLGIVEMEEGWPVQVYASVSWASGARPAARRVVEHAARLAVGWPPSTPHGEVVHPVDGSLLVRVPAGPFTMGDWLKRHQLELPDYYISRHPITNRQYRHYLSTTGEMGNVRWQLYAQKYGEDVPAAQVSWFEAQAYAKWAGLRLPTGAEWEKAARGEDGRKWPWGDEWEASACCTGLVGPDARPAKAPIAVGQFPHGVSPYGCHDMAGNVWEWCSSKFRPYPFQAGDGREDPEGREPREIRGGAWTSTHLTSVSAREGLKPDQASDYVGFRVVGDPA